MPRLRIIVQRRYFARFRRWEWALLSDYPRELAAGFAFTRHGAKRAAERRARRIEQG